jgi:hypothetical protein
MVPRLTLTGNRRSLEAWATLVRLLDAVANRSDSEMSAGVNRREGDIKFPGKSKIAHSKRFKRFKRFKGFCGCDSVAQILPSAKSKMQKAGVPWQSLMPAMVLIKRDFSVDKAA